MKRQGSKMKKLISMFLVCGVLAGSLFSATVQAEESSQEPIRIEFESYMTSGMSIQKSKDASRGYAAQGIAPTISCIAVQHSAETAATL